MIYDINVIKYFKYSIGKFREYGNRFWRVNMRERANKKKLPKLGKL